MSLLFDAAVVAPVVAIAAAKSDVVLPEGASAATTIAVGGAITLSALCLSKFLKKIVIKKIHGGCCHTKCSKTTVAEVPAPETIPNADQTLSLIKKRRSVFPKDFSGEAVPRESIEKMLEAANWAPTHGLSEAFRFVVIEGDERKKMENLIVSLIDEKLPAEKAQGVHAKLTPKRAHWPKVSAFIALCYKQQPNPSTTPNPEWEEVASTSAAAQNMALVGASLGIASYWASFPEVARDSNEFKAYLGLTPEDRCIGVLVVGQSDRISGYRGKRGDWKAKVDFRA